MRMRLTATIALLAAVWLAAPVLAHEVTIQGTVAAIEKTRIQVKTGKEKTGEASTWYPIGSKTKIKRGKSTIAADKAAIAVNERVVLIVDHPDKGPIVVKEIRLAEK
jgi:hypothetical protein